MGTEPARDENMAKGLKRYAVNFELAGTVEVEARDENEARIKAGEVSGARLIELVENIDFGNHYVHEL